jgi:hypothetical protein
VALVAASLVLAVSCARAAPAVSLLINPCGSQVNPPPCAAALHPLGEPVTFWVIARDAQSGFATNYTSTVRITSSDASASLPAAHTYTLADASVFAFTITFNSSGAGVPSEHTVVATDAANGLTASGVFFVVPPERTLTIPALSRSLQALLAGLLAALGAWDLAASRRRR